MRDEKIYLETMLDRFERAKEALINDKVNYECNPEGKELLIKYYDERINSYSKQLAKLTQSQINDITVNGAEHVRG